MDTRTYKNLSSLMIGIERKNHTLLTIRSLWLDEWCRIVAGFKNSNTIKKTITFNI